MKDFKREKFIIFPMRIELWFMSYEPKSVLPLVVAAERETNLVP